METSLVESIKAVYDLKNNAHTHTHVYIHPPTHTLTHTPTPAIIPCMTFDPYGGAEGGRVGRATDFAALPIHLISLLCAVPYVECI